MTDWSLIFRISILIIIVTIIYILVARLDIKNTSTDHLNYLTEKSSNNILEIYHEVRCIQGNNWFDYVTRYDLDNTTDSSLKERYVQLCLSMNLNAMTYSTIYNMTESEVSK